MTAVRLPALAPGMLTRDHDVRPGAVLGQEPAAPVVLHVDVAEIVQGMRPVGDVPMPHPETPLEYQLLQAARACAAGGVQPPRRELVAAALREADRQQWWRDQAEAEVVALRRELAAARVAVATVREVTRG